LSSQFQLTTREGETASQNLKNVENAKNAEKAEKFEKSEKSEKVQVMNEPVNLPNKTSKLPDSKRLKFENDEKVIIGLESSTLSQVEESTTPLLIGQETLCDEITMTIDNEITKKPSKSRLKPKRNFIKL